MAWVATVLTVYGIETRERDKNRIRKVATVLTVYGIETSRELLHYAEYSVATVLTVYGIETSFLIETCWITDTVQLQQYLPFTVLKLNTSTTE